MLIVCDCFWDYSIIEETIFPTEFNCVISIRVYQTTVAEKKPNLAAEINSN